jgi:hypothetical protein
MSFTMPQPHIRFFSCNHRVHYGAFSWGLSYMACIQKESRRFIKLSFLGAYGNDYFRTRGPKKKSTQPENKCFLIGRKLKIGPTDFTLEPIRQRGPKEINPTGKQVLSYWS